MASSPMFPLLGSTLLLSLSVACSTAPTNPWLAEDAELSWAWAGILIVEQEVGAFVFELSGSGELPELNSLDDLQLGSGSFRWFSAEAGKLEPLVGLTGLSSVPEGPGDRKSTV